MASLSADAGGNRILQFTNADGFRKTIRLGKRTEKTADKIREKVELLADDAKHKRQHASHVVRWIRHIEHEDASLYDKLAEHGLVPPRVVAGQVTVELLCTSFINNRFGDVKGSTSTIYGHAKRNLMEYFGAGKRADSINAAEAEDWRRWLGRAKDKDNPAAGGQGLDRETVKLRCRIAKQMFRDAVRRKLLDENPFADLKGLQSKGNKEKEYFVTQEEATKILASCPDNEWRLMFALSRYGGMRCPSEHLRLRWRDVDWEHGRIVVHSPKTEHHAGKASRIMPLFPELQPYLQAAWEAAPEGAEYVITRWRTTETNLRSRLHDIITAAGLQPWPKAFVALRSTRATELREMGFPDHVVNSWIGHSQGVAMRHYLQVTDAHFDQALSKKNAARALHSFPKGSDTGVPVVVPHRKSPRNLRSGTTRNGKDGRCRTRTRAQVQRFSRVAEMRCENPCGFSRH
jgi:integrase